MPHIHYLMKCTRGIQCISKLDLQSRYCTRRGPAFFPELEFSEIVQKLAADIKLTSACTGTCQQILLHWRCVSVVHAIAQLRLVTIMHKE